tara:strand:- start:10922 stop:12175 length:1254 start_codon:yes stop_codon:yes gene_type:complete
MAQDFIFDRKYYEDASLDTGNSGFHLARQYQHTDFHSFLNGFMVSYVGEDKIIRKANRTEVSFFAQRGLQELSYDTIRSIKAQEFEVPNNLSFILPKDYVNYSRVAVVDSSGLYRTLYPERKTGNAFRMVQDEYGQPSFDTGDNFQDDGLGPDGQVDMQRMTQVATNVITCNIRSFGATSPDNPVYILENFTLGSIADVRKGLMLDANRDMSNPMFNRLQTGSTGIVRVNKAPSQIINPLSPFIFLNKFVGGDINEVVTFVTHESTALTNYKTSQNVNSDTVSYDPNVDNDLMDVYGRRYGLESERAQINGSYYIDHTTGRIRFGSSLVGQVVVLEYISDSLGNEYEMVIHKFAEEALYKYVQYNLASVRAGIPGNILAMLKKEARAAKRNAKLRLSNFKIEEFAQVLRNQNKFIKH